MDKEHLLSLLQENQAADFLRVDETEEFLVECIFLNHWDQELKHEPLEEGVDELDLKLVPESNPDCLYITFVYQDDEVMLIYVPDTNHPGKHALEIYHDQNIVYSRQASHNPATEWDINGMANDLKDENGNFYFTGDHTNI